MSVFFFKQKTAYEVRISDWSSDVCSSDLVLRRQPETFRTLPTKPTQVIGRQVIGKTEIGNIGKGMPDGGEFPIQHRQHLCRSGAQDHVITAIIAMDDRAFVAFGKLVMKPRNDTIDRKSDVKGKRV